MQPWHTTQANTHRSQRGRHFYLSNGEEDSPNNGAILTIATIIKAVMSSAAEAELGALSEREEGSIFTPHAHRNGTPAATNTDPKKSSTTIFNPNKQRKSKD